MIRRRPAAAVLAGHPSGEVPMPVQRIDATLCVIAIAGGLAGIVLIVRLLRP